MRELIAKFPEQDSFLELGNDIPLALSLTKKSKPGVEMHACSLEA